jgi:hypothetical protein
MLKRPQQSGESRSWSVRATPAASVARTPARRGALFLASPCFGFLPSSSVTIPHSATLALWLHPATRPTVPDAGGA